MNSRWGRVLCGRAFGLPWRSAFGLFPSPRTLPRSSTCVLRPHPAPFRSWAPSTTVSMGAAAAALLWGCREARPGRRGACPLSVPCPSHGPAQPFAPAVTLRPHRLPPSRFEQCLAHSTPWLCGLPRAPTAAAQACRPLLPTAQAWAASPTAWRLLRMRPACRLPPRRTTLRS